MTPDITVLANGLTVISLTLPRVETVSIGLYAGVGARFETAAQAGISHFLEHMVFKGSDRRSARALAEAVEDVGGSINAYTARDVTGYYIRVLKEDSALAIDILSDLVFGAKLDPAEVERERDVILQEIGQVQDTPDDLVFDQLQEIAYAGQSFGAPILGTPDTIAAIDSDALKGFRQTHYVGGNLILAAAGHMTHAELVKLAEAGFGSVAAGPKIVPDPAHWTGGVQHITRPSEQMHMALAIPTCGLEHPDLYATQVYSTMLGGGMSSRLFQDVREERGLAYSVFSDVSAHAGAGYLTLYAGTNPPDAAEALKVMRGCLRSMCDVEDEKELIRGKAQLKTGLAMALESSLALAEQMGRQMLAFGRFIPPEELLDKVDAVTLEDVRRIALDIASFEKPALSTVGPEGFQLSL